MDRRATRRYVRARRRGKPTVLFLRRPTWERALRRSCRAVEPFFFDLHEVDARLFDLVVPLGLDGTRAIRRTRPHLPGRRALIPDPETIELCADRLVFAQHLLRHGLDEIVPSIGPDLSYPYVLKPHVRTRNIDASIVENVAQAEQHLDALTRPEYFRQQYVPGDEKYVTHFAARDGHLLAARTVATGRGKAAADHMDRDGLLGSIVGAVDFTGIGCLTYKVVDNRPKVLELAPRVGESLHRCADDILLAAVSSLSVSPPRWTSAPTAASSRGRWCSP